MKEYRNRHKMKAAIAAVESEGTQEAMSEKSWKKVDVLEGPGSIHVSVTVGQSEKYGMNKFAVTVGHTLSCGQAAEDKSQAYEEAKSFCTEHIQSLRTEVRETLFPQAFLPRSK